MKFVLWVAMLGIVCVAYAQTAHDVKKKDVPEFLRQLADDRKTIADGYVHWTEGAKAKNVDAILNMYTDDATVLPEEKEAASEGMRLRVLH